ncbi:nucleoid occlusion protein [Salipaludibacillus agaradhaerens]|uniref:nucleoid occlusion protein n=1 Tax=Salipaludibacillus agaradhaerens TaxID=76935 RepID=UPI0021511B2A|nr:nucleoid occlusion protein [Salipaludibacillus agaradhaerens]MCR6108547.1 nucleoid occlusion protein [Salipaludibacillus agaradhaerens]MCR6120568.1 nucleoid occlusion protein [Salipaludibacillus agaradhaerens]UJW59575.1 nucleoid occlusion protein [Bacillus sp. A116_S68]
MKQSFSKLFGLNEKNEGIEDNVMSETEEVKQLPVADIVPNRYQPRTVFHDDKIDELAQTIKTHGIIQPIVVRERNGRFEIIAGERRWRAVTKLGWEHIPAVIKDLDDTKTASVALIENLQREGLTSIEEAMAYAKLLELHGLTQESLAQRLGKGQSTVANKLRLLNLPASVQDALLNRRITERHARALIGLKDKEKQEKVLEKIIEQELNVKQTEELIAKLSEEVPKKKRKAIRKAVSKDTRLAMNTIRKSVDMVAQTGMTIDTDEEEHDDFYQFTIRIPKK